VAEKIAQSRISVHRRLTQAFLDSPEVVGAINLGSTAFGTEDEYSDLDYFVYSDEPNWPRERTLAWLARAGLVPEFCYWSGVEKYHMMIDGVGVDFSIRAASQIIEVSTWPTLHFPESAILKDGDGAIAQQLSRRDPQVLRAGLDNTLHGCLYHSLACVTQLRRGELVNARSRFSGVIESFICLLEETVVGQIRWREPSRRLESRFSGATLDEVFAIAYAASPEEIVAAVERVLRTCEERVELTDADRATIARIRQLIEEFHA
jgi:hypothetical protein